MKNLALVLFVASVVGCSSSETTTTPGGGASSGGASSGASSCSCNVSINGDSKHIECGGSACVGGQSYECGAQAALSQSGNACASSSSSSSGSTSSSSSGGATATTVDCPDAKGAVDGKCDATKEYCILAKNGGSAAACVPFPNGCSKCGCASEDADAAWRKANNNTANCGTGTIGTAIVTCQSSNGAVTVTCDYPH